MTTTDAPDLPVLTLPEELPITAWADDIIAAIRNHQVLIVAGETGSGKTTQLPKLALMAGRQQIGHTQPRRIAARSVAERIAAEVGVELGDLVGYQVRFTRKSSRQTRIKLMTDGVLLNEIGFDRDLRRYDTIIIDEAHERSLNIDFLLGYLKQLLPRRPELKVIVTSATIDTARFSEHFDDAPIIEVSGRTYPVEVRYRPLYDDGADSSGSAAIEKDQLDGIAEAIAELSTEGAGDILVFLSGEREIRDTADYLESLKLRFTEIVPLYARLSAAEQHKVFSPHTGRRIVLATNVAETSLTVPGIRYVIDAGTARISRYSARTKVQRLPIEPISRASANQRAGRCGRIGPGIAIRLYSQADYEARPEFTEPEILRTNLASVILQMADARLGAVEDFPFVESPDRSQIADGRRLLDELGALEPSPAGAPPKLTPIGRQLARIPVDPRLGRMIVEAAKRGCLSEVLIIVAGLSIQDPRERPHEHQEQADLLHRRFWSDAILTGEEVGANDGGDFLALLRLWRYVQSQRRALSGNAFRRLCRDEFLSYLRLREWADLLAQLRDVADDLKLGGYSEESSGSVDCVNIHTCLLAGLLSHVGLADLRNVNPNLPARKRVRLGPQEYLGARGAKFAIQRGSSLAKHPPTLVVAFELVETTRLWARTVAAVEPEWIEAVAGHLLKRHYSEPHWSSKQGAALAYEQVSLLGIPIVANRRVQYARIDPVAAREIFIQSALVEGDWQTRHHFFARNQRVREQAAEMEERTRRRDIVVSDAQLAAFYDARIPADVVTQVHFDRWWRQERRRNEHLLDLTLDDLLDPEADFDEGLYPDDWVVPDTDLALPIDYTFDPGAGHDGVTITIPLTIINQLDSAQFTWHVPGMREELAVELVRSLPRSIRTRYVPAPNYAHAALAWLTERDRIGKGRFALALGEALTALTGDPVPPTAWHLEEVPPHLRIGFVVIDAGREVARGEDLAELQRRLAVQVSRTLTKVAASSTLTGAKAWVFGAIPTETTFDRGGSTIIGYPALVDEGATVGLAVMDTTERQHAVHALGLRRLVALQIVDPSKLAIAYLTMEQKLALTAGPYTSVVELVADARLASIGSLIEQTVGDPSLVRDETAFLRLADEVRVRHADDLRDVVAVAADALRWHAQAVRELAGLPDSEARADMEEQLANLVYPGFIAATPEPHYHQLPRYLHAVCNRIDMLKANPVRESANLDIILELEDEYAELCATQPPGPLSRSIAEIGWQLEELRVSLFAQSLGTRGRISVKRLRAALEAAR